MTSTHAGAPESESAPDVPRLGIAYVAGFPPEQLQVAARTAEAAGLDEFWLWEDCFTHGGVSTTAVALASTQNITVGIGLLPVPLRNVALTAMEMASMHRLFPGRLKAGVGHGSQEWMGQAGARVESPMTLLNEYQEVLRRLLEGERVSYHGRYLRIEDIQLEYPPTMPVQLLLGGRGPKSLRLAAHAGDGTLLDAGQGLSEVRQACDAILGERQANAPNRPGLHQIFSLLIAATGDKADERLHREASHWSSAPAPDVGVSGNAADIAQAVLALAECGVTSVVIQPTQDEPDLMGLIEFLGQEVKPKLAARSRKGVKGDDGVGE